MNPKARNLLVAGLAVMAGTAVLLSVFRSNQKLGNPGLRIIAQPVLDPEGNVVGTNSVYLPDFVLDYVSEVVPVTPLELGWLPPDTTYGRRRYRSPDGLEILTSVVLMGTDRTSIHKPQYCLTGQGWQIESTQPAHIRIQRPHPYDLPVMVLTASAAHRTEDGQTIPVRGVYVYWFVAEDYLTESHTQRMWWLARELITHGTLQRWAYVSCFALCVPGGEEAAYARVERFIQASVPDFQLTTGPELAGEPEVQARQF